MDPFATPLLTERLRLRRMEAGDLDAVAALQSDPDVVRYLPWPLRDREQSRAWLDERIAADRLEADDDGVVWAVVRRDDGGFVGSVNLWLRSVEHQQAEIGFVLAPRAQGEGYGSEAARRVLEVAFGGLGAHRVFGRADARNDRSAALMRRLGMRQEAHLREDERMRGEWTDTVVFALLRREWEASGEG